MDEVGEVSGDRCGVRRAHAHTCYCYSTLIGGTCILHKRGGESVGRVEQRRARPCAKGAKRCVADTLARACRSARAIAMAPCAWSFRGNLNRFLVDAPILPCLIVLLSLFNLSLCLYEDQVGKFDW